MKRICKLLGAALLISAVILADTGCISPRKAGNPETMAESSGNPDASEADDHKIAPLEIIIVDVFGEKDFESNEDRVQASGGITFPFLNEIEVAGKTPLEVGKIIREQLISKNYLADPQVTVRVKEYRLRTVNVSGEVNKPGAITLPGEFKWTILDAISQAGGLSRGAAKTKIDFTRKGVTTRWSIDKLNKMADPKKIIYLEPGDTILVNQSVW
jgi:polysaccharide export outer membrane protein